jgi:hypothetical protein
MVKSHFQTVHFPALVTGGIGENLCALFRSRNEHAGKERIGPLIVRRYVTGAPCPTRAAPFFVVGSIIW